MKKGKIIAWIVGLIIVFTAAFFTYQYFWKEDSKSTLTLMEKQWIESNKNKVIDFEIKNDLPVFTSDGIGVVFDFLTDLEKDTALEFNKLPVAKDSDMKSAYGVDVVSRASKDDILIYRDNYVMLTNEKKVYYRASEINNLKIGVLKEDLKQAEAYLKDHNQISFQTFDNVEALISALRLDKDKTSTVDGILLPKMYYLNEILKNDTFSISYNISDYTKDYVIKLGKTGKLNTILKKYFTKWKKNDYDQSFATNFSDNYFNARKIDEQQKSKFRAKRYAFGYVDEKPYSFNLEGTLYGDNIKKLKRFANLANIEIDFKRYRNNHELQEAFNTNKIDAFYNNTSKRNYNLDVYQTLPAVEASIVVVSKTNNPLVLTSLQSLKDRTVLVVEDSKIADVMKKIGAHVKTYATIGDMINQASANNIMIMDQNNYRYYQHTELANYKIDYQTTIDSYAYYLRDMKSNQIFNDYFNFYISSDNDQASMNESIQALISIGNKPSMLKNLFLTVGILLTLGVLYFVIKKYKEFKNRTVTVSKTEKLRYIDALTSLKNRAYLNDHIEAWDASEVYPQSIIIIDLNNVAYINDNYGHQEGDNLIKEAANKLITTQIENSDIIRTNGNEFLIYMVGYDEKQVITYIRKLNKEFKDLSHGYGAAIGYSMIHDAIKTIDDAVNEATLDMRNNKEEINN